ncbi:hypothetical protein L1987_15569 [Smallanthus sonchifolius]|uniref:Uncharacterized protein n=1 Tax=Smallanthus sonchifolius TaxID=185202 RepID=A0ACB9J6Y4_9ASTR|nr:hypothetical protein L1987_15569 [Smallanthus sonchifolius]
MIPRWSRTLGNLYRHTKSSIQIDLYVLPCRKISIIAAVEVPVASDASVKSEVNLNKMFRSKPSSLALPQESSMRIEEPTYSVVKIARR